MFTSKGIVLPPTVSRSRRIIFPLQSPCQTDLVGSRERDRRDPFHCRPFDRTPLAFRTRSRSGLRPPIPSAYAYPYATFRRPGRVVDVFAAILARRIALLHRRTRHRGRFAAIGRTCDLHPWISDRVGSQEVVRGGDETGRTGRTQPVSAVKFDEESTQNVAQAKRFDSKEVFYVRERRKRKQSVPNSRVERTSGIHGLIRRQRSTNGDAAHLDPSCTLGRRQRRRS